MAAASAPAQVAASTARRPAANGARKRE
jgi:hypothetical protein